MQAEIRAVAFDAFGTLIRYPVKHHPYTLLRAKGQDRAVFHRQCMISGLTAAELASANGREEALPEFSVRLAEEERHIALYPEVSDLLDNLRQQGIRMAVCSNLACEYGRILRRLLPEWLDLALSCEIGAAKPESVIYAAVENLLGVPRGQILFVGDSKTNDAAAPAAYGFQSLWLQRPQQDLRIVQAAFSYTGNPFGKQMMGAD